MTPSLRTINDLFRRVTSAHNPRAVLWQQPSGQWNAISSDQIYHRTRVLAQSFLALGVQKGDRIALISENRWEWAITDFAALAVGCVDVPLYPTLTGDQMAVMLKDAGCKIAVVSTLQQFSKINAVQHHTDLERIVMMDEDCPEGAISFRSLVKSAEGCGEERDAAFDSLVSAVQPEDFATLIYTSGTTGEPKGVALTHANIAANQNIAAIDFNLNSSDVCISFLPLSHITARALDYVMYYFGAQLAYCSQFDKMPQAMLEIRPTVFVGVPRVFEKIRHEVERQAGLSVVKKRLLAKAIRIGEKHLDVVYDGRVPSSIAWKLVNKLVYAKVRKAFGGRVRIFVSGGAPLGIDTARWFASAGIALWEGYGLTETSPVIALNTPRVHRMGSAGMPLSNLELKLADDGELLVRGPSVFLGYWNKPEATAECLNDEGWFSTGDIGCIDKDGFLFITDRKKELLKTSGGKLVAPQPIENKLKNNSFVGQAALQGDKHKFITALISPNFMMLEGWAAQQGIDAVSRAQLVADVRVVNLYAEIVREVNSGLANFEALKRFRLVPDEWTQESGELTPSMKLKRRAITERYTNLIAELYADEATARAGST